MTSVGAGPRPVTIAAAVNDPAVLAACLASSPEVADGRLPLRTYRGAPCASLAYNQALDEAATDIVVLAHQDVYLPAGFWARLEDELRRLEASDPDWAVVGVIGIDETGDVVGQTWSSGLRQLVGQKATQPTSVVTLDEVLLVVRRSSGIRFDPAMPGFHLYAADIVQAARTAGRRCYALDIPIVHHSRPVVRFDAGYWSAYRFMQKKWRKDLPLPNLVCPIERSRLRLLVRDGRLRWRYRGRAERRPATGDPASIARQLGME